MPESKLRACTDMTERVRTSKGEALYTCMKTLYTPLDNFFFFKVMGEKGDEVQLLGFINAVLQRTDENRFNSVEILENKTFSEA